MAESKYDSKEEAPSAKMASISGGYEQIYVILKNSNSSTDYKSEQINEALFRCGNWCYRGMVQFNGLKMTPADIPMIIPTLQKQQGALRYYCNSNK
jgi:hypothetical protein